MMGETDEFSTGWNGMITRWKWDLMAKKMTSEIPVLKLNNTRLRSIPV